MPFLRMFDIFSVNIKGEFPTCLSFGMGNDISYGEKSIVLGKSGYLTFIYVVVIDPDTDLVQHATIAKEFANTTVFNEGSKYSDYKSGDKIAAVGIGGLVAGTLGVKALAKVGILAKFLPFLAKFWWIILAPIAAIFGFAKKSSSSDAVSTDTESKPRRRKRKK